MPNGHRIIQGMDDWMRSTEKRLSHEERRPVIRRASDLLGPGFTGPYATEVTDWNAEEARYNGFFYSDVGADNSPDETKVWIGTCVATRLGHGLQQVWSHEDAADPVQYVRTWHAHDDSPAVQYGAWVTTTPSVP